LLTPLFSFVNPGRITYEEQSSIPLKVDMTRLNLDQDIQQVKDEILILGSMVEQAMTQAVEALKNNDLERSKAILNYDQRINEKRYHLEGTVITLIATQQPMAHDLRVLAAALEICTELERMGDYAKGIASINLRSGGLSLPKILRDIHYMAQKTLDMLHRSLTAFVEEDKQAATVIARDDDIIDALYEQLYFEMMDLLAEEPENIERANYVLWVGHNLERMADRVTNICERTVYIKTGDLTVEFG
jgi:phosphate transport system protein